MQTKDKSECLDADALRKKFHFLKNVKLLGDFRIDQFRNGKHDLVQLTLDFETLLVSLDKFAKKHNAKVYVKACDYQYTATELKSSGENSFLKGVENFDDKTFIDLMSLKRRAFASENELRFFIYGDNLPFDGSHVNVPYKGKFVRAIKICPHPDIKAFLSDEEIVKGAVEKKLKAKDNGIHIEMSRLYDNVSTFTPKKGNVSYLSFQNEKIQNQILNKRSTVL